LQHDGLYAQLLLPNLVIHAFKIPAESTGVEEEPLGDLPEGAILLLVDRWGLMPVVWLDRSIHPNCL
jgi:hypothetical protein